MPPYSRSRRAVVAFAVAAAALMMTAAVAVAVAVAEGDSASATSSLRASVAAALRVEQREPLVVCTNLNSADPPVRESHATCGGVDAADKLQPLCNEFASASYVGPAKSIICPAGTFRDLDACWKCPDKAPARSEFPVTDTKACQRSSGYSHRMAATMVVHLWCPRQDRVFQDLGKCWRCPDWAPIRTLNPVTDPRACAKDLFGGPWGPAADLGPSRATCPFGTFFDVVEGGSCWKCPDNTVRTVFPVNGAEACENRGFMHAIHVGDVGCGAGAIWDPSRDLGGSCWTCPAGHRRTVQAVTSDHACVNDQISWVTRRANVGLYNIGDTRTMLMHLTHNVTKAAVALRTIIRATAKNRAQLEALVKEISSTGPVPSRAVAALVYLSLLAAMQAPAHDRSPAETCTIRWLGEFIRNTRIYVASEALKMHDNWKRAYDLRKSQEQQMNLLGLLGSVAPVPNFNAMVTGAVGHGMAFAPYLSHVGAAAGSGMLAGLGYAAIVSSPFIGNGMAPMLFIKILLDFDTMAAGFATLAGPAAIVISGIFIAAVRLRQVLDFVEAHPQLVEALDKARNFHVDEAWIKNAVSGQEYYQAEAHELQLAFSAACVGDEAGLAWDSDLAVRLRQVRALVAEWENVGGL